MVCGHEKRLTWLTVGEATLDLALSIGLVLYFKTSSAWPLGRWWRRHFSAGVASAVGRRAK